MAYLRLVSSSTKKEFAIATRVIDGYFINPEYDRITLYTQSSSIEVYSPVMHSWDNWDEFIEQIKAKFEDSNDDF